MERFSRGRRLLYANGHLGFSILDNLFGVYLIFGRIIDSLADPLVAWWSDNARFKTGRRKFFMASGALFVLAGFFVFLRFPQKAVTDELTEYRSRTDA